MIIYSVTSTESISSFQNDEGHGTTTSALRWFDISSNVAINSGVFNFLLYTEYKQPYPILFYAKHTKASIGIEGDVQEAMDKLIGRNVYRIRGAISAKNHVTWQDMDIAGPTLFIQAFLPEPYISTMHFEVSTKNNQSLRISISTLYNGDEPKFLGRSLR